MDLLSETAQKTKQAFIESFCLINKTKPIPQISIQEVSRKAGYNRSTFYQYFQNIYDLVEYIENDLLQSVLEKKKHIRPNNTHDFIYSIIDSYHENELCIDALLGKYGSEHFMNMLKEQIKINVLEESIDDSNPIKSYLVEFRVSSSLSIFRHWIKQSKNISIEELVKLITTLYQNGVSGII